jgi:mRNA-degrading endonuclease RelE of RelBE toxin-antitoxin system
MALKRIISLITRTKTFKYPDPQIQTYLKELISEENYHITTRRREGEWGADCGYDGTSRTNILETSGNKNKVLKSVNNLVDRYDDDKPGLWSPEHFPLDKVSVRKKNGGKIRLKIGRCPLIYTVKINPIK